MVHFSPHLVIVNAMLLTSVAEYRLAGCRFSAQPQINYRPTRDAVSDTRNTVYF